MRFAPGPLGPKCPLFVTICSPPPLFHFQRPNVLFIVNHVDPHVHRRKAFYLLFFRQISNLNFQCSQWHEMDHLWNCLVDFWNRVQPNELKNFSSQSSYGSVLGFCLHSKVSVLPTSFLAIHNPHCSTVVSFLLVKANAEFMYGVGPFLNLCTHWFDKILHITEDFCTSDEGHIYEFMDWEVLLILRSSWDLQWYVPQKELTLIDHWSLIILRIIGNRVQFSHS